jgi:hypothetical protein
MKTFGDVVRKVFPNATDKEANDLLWAHTAFPFETDPKPLVKQLRTFKKTNDAGELACDFCNRPAAKGDILCRPCARSWEKLRRKQRLEEEREERKWLRSASKPPRKRGC